jgi:predicted ATPase
MHHVERSGVVSARHSIAAELRLPSEARRRAERLLAKRHEREARSVQLARDFEQLNRYLGLADQVTSALEQLSQQLFQELLNAVEDKLSVALQEILEQPIRFRARADFKRGAATVEFSIERDGNTEDVLKGQGGSVVNILSVGLRMFALLTLDENRHRRFLVLDEQDCWLRPDLVPKLVKIVHEAGKALGLQVLMISHHDVAIFERFADKIYQFVPKEGGAVEVRELAMQAADADLA